MSWHELTMFVFCDLCLAFWHPYFGYHCEFKDATQRPGPVKSWCQSWFLLLSLISCWLNAWCNTFSLNLTFLQVPHKFHMGIFGRGWDRYEIFPYWGNQHQPSTSYDWMGSIRKTIVGASPVARASLGFDDSGALGDGGTWASQRRFFWDQNLVDRNLVDL